MFEPDRERLLDHVQWNRDRPRPSIDLTRSLAYYIDCRIYPGMIKTCSSTNYSAGWIAEEDESLGSLKLAQWLRQEVRPGLVSCSDKVLSLGCPPCFLVMSGPRLRVRAIPRSADRQSERLNTPKSHD